MQPEPMKIENVEEIFYRANFIRDLGIRLEKIGAGTCETSIP